MCGRPVPRVLRVSPVFLVTMGLFLVFYVQ